MSGRTLPGARGHRDLPRPGREEANPMHDHADRLGGKPTGGLPVISGAKWFGTKNRPLVLHIEYPLAFDEIVAALYGTVEAGDMATNEDLGGSVAVALLLEGI